MHTFIPLHHTIHYIIHTLHHAIHYITYKHTYMGSLFLDILGPGCFIMGYASEVCSSTTQTGHVLKKTNPHTVILYM